VEEDQSRSDKTEHHVNAKPSTHTAKSAEHPHALAERVDQ
jgi:hypothetical protein